MLAQTPEHDKQIAQFREVLRLPDKGDELRDAEAVQQRAKAELDALGERRTKAHSALHNGQFASRRITLDRELELKTEIAGLDREMKRCGEAEKAARDTVAQLRQTYERDVHQLLGPACRSLMLTIDATLQNAQALYALADEVRAEARLRGIDIEAGTLIGGGAQFSRLLDQLRASLAKLTLKP